MSSDLFFDTSSDDEDEVNSELAMFTEACQAAYEASKPKVHRTTVERDRYGAHDRLVMAYFSEQPQYDEATFRERFRMSRRLFTKIVREVTDASQFFQERYDCRGQRSISALMKCTSAIRQLAYGCVIMNLYGEEFLRKPTYTDIEKLYAYHNEKHGFPGMLGSIDYTDWPWANCPVAFKAQFSRGDHRPDPFILLEAIASNDLWIWHAFFGSELKTSELDTSELKTSEYRFLKIFILASCEHEMGTFRETLSEGTEGALHLGLPKDIYTLINHYTDANDIWDNVKMLLEGSELTKEDRESQLYDDFKHFRQNKGETIYDYYVRFTKLINDMRNIKMTMSRMQLNSKFVDNMLPEWGRFVTAVKLNRGLRDSNYDQLYAYLKQHEAHANENKMMLDRFTQHTVDPLALMSNVSHQQYYSQSSTTPPSTYVPPHFADNSQLDSGLSSMDNLIENLTNTLALLTQSYKTYLPQTNNQLRYSSNPRNQATVQDGRVVVQNVQGRKNRGQGNNVRGAGAAGYGGAQNRVGNANPGQAKQNSEYFKDKMLVMQAQENGVALDEEQLLFIAGGQDNAIDEDVDEQPVQDLALNVDNVFQAGDCDAFDYDVDEAPTAQTMFMANLSSAYPVYDEAGPSYDSDILSEVHDHDHYQDVVCEHHEEHEMHDEVQPNYVVDSHVNYTSDSNMIPYDQYVKDNTVPVRDGKKTQTQWGNPKPEVFGAGRGMLIGLQGGFWGINGDPYLVRGGDGA
ncbi:retrovirus-related pol polyprotein from transposon TNT 1-94 [Tanacetum coccineum]|uniref:Retrovirus-related pol polyprotein from transposon TNT 1-94 n=1 Tax=Tanacetum coccineum TaxID=301880 RepID=A0ABQ5E3U3_9ASTR